jgi:NAD dependent epimerase/dehydratase family enzyme
MPWIHIDDLCGIYLKAIQDLKMEGAYNANSPQHIMQKEFMRMLAKVLNRPFFNPQVAAILFRAFLGEMADVVLKGSRISPEKIINSGFSFSFSNLENALKDLLKSEDKILTI